MSKKEYNIPKSSHYSLIGRGGSVIRGLQNDFNVRIRVPRKEEDSTTVTVTGDERDIEACKAEIEYILGFKVGTQELAKLVLDIPKSKYGAILGHGGSTIRKLEKENQCSISLPRRNSNSTLVTIEGPEDKLKQCEKAIEEVIGIEVGAASNNSNDNASSSNNNSVPTKGEINEALFFPDLDASDGFSYSRFLKYLSSATKTLEVCVFTITDNAVSNLLVKLFKAGVKVRVITDNDTSVNRGSDIQALRNAGIPLRMDKTQYHMHNKFAVIDDRILLTGSYNWTTSASTKNNENMIATTNRDLVDAFGKHFEELWVQFK